MSDVTQAAVSFHRFRDPPMKRSASGRRLAPGWLLREKFEGVCAAAQAELSVVTAENQHDLLRKVVANVFTDTAGSRVRA